MFGMGGGGPLSSMLFNIVIDMLEILIAGAKEDNQVPRWSHPAFS